MKKQKINIYQTINEMVIEGLKKDGLQWFMPWKSGMGNSPINNVTGRAYSGINIFLLNATMRAFNYETNEWLTYNQASSKGGNVKKGQRSTAVTYWNISFYDVTQVGSKTFYRTLAQALSSGVSQENVRKAFSLQVFRVFNIGQCENIEPKRVVVEAPVGPVENGNCDVARSICDTYLLREKIALSHNGTSSAYYSPSQDSINMPVEESFQDCDSYFKTLFHEISHSTGHETRLKRIGVTTIGKNRDLYAKEELVAEITAMYMSGLTGLEPKDSHDNSQAYLNGWVKRITDSKGKEEKFVVSAMTQASKSSNFIQEPVKVKVKVEVKANVEKVLV